MTESVVPTRRSAPDSAYTIFSNIVGLIPAAILVTSTANFPYRMHVMFGGLAIFLFGAMLDLRGKPATYLAITLIVDVVAIAGISISALEYDILANNIGVGFLTLGAFLLKPSENSPTRVDDVRKRAGSRGFEKVIVYKRHEFIEKSLVPVDFAIFGPTANLKFLLGDYYTEYSSTHPQVFLAYTFAILSSLAARTDPSVLSTMQVTLFLPGAFILGYGIKVYLAVKYAPKDVTMELIHRMELKPKKNTLDLISGISKRMILAGGILLIIGFVLPVTQSQTPASWANFREPSADFLRAFALIPALMLISWPRQMWETLWVKQSSPIRRSKKRKNH